MTGNCSDFKSTRCWERRPHDHADGAVGAHGTIHAGGPYGPLSHIHVWPGSLAQPVSEAEAPPVVPGGDGIRVAVIDTGLAEHWWIGPRRHRNSDGEVPASLGDGRLSPVYGHGTFVAGVVHRYAGDATILGKQVPLTHGGRVAAGDMARAIRAVKEFRPHVVNLSFGVDVHSTQGVGELEGAIDEMLRAQWRPVIVAAAGNHGCTARVLPAAFPGVVAAGAVGPDGQRAVRDLSQPFPFEHWESNYGDWLDVGAVGVEVVSAFPPPDRGLARCDGKASGELSTGFAVWEGTSFAAPAIAGAIAHRAAADRLTPVDALQSLLEEPGIPYAEGIGPVPNLPGRK